MATLDPIIYEQPVNEHVRVCLRLEHLFEQLMHWIHGANSWDSRAAVASLLEILNVLDRPDIKAKLVKELSRYSSVLTRFASIPHIDKTKLHSVQQELDHMLRNLHSMQGRFAQELRENDFLANVRQYLANPGGGTNFEVPEYHYWLNLSANERITHLTEWMASLKIVQKAINLSLRLIRQSSPAQLHVATNGFYQAGLDAQIPCQLVRISVARHISVYPEISVGRHGVSIRFYTLNLQGRSIQSQEDIKFYLTCCVF